MCTEFESARCACIKSRGQGFQFWKKTKHSGFAKAPELPIANPQIAFRTAISDSLPFIVLGRSPAGTTQLGTWRGEQCSLNRCLIAAIH
jgi:hypothetical protein